MAAGKRHLCFFSDLGHSSRRFAVVMASSRSSVRPLSSLQYFRADRLCKHGMNGGRDAQLYSFVGPAQGISMAIFISDCKMYCTGGVVSKRIIIFFNNDLGTKRMIAAESNECNKLSNYSDCQARHKSECF